MGKKCLPVPVQSGGVVHASEDASIEFANVSATENSAGDGAVLYSEGAQITVAGLRAVRNEAGYRGGFATLTARTEFAVVEGSPAMVLENNSALVGGAMALAYGISGTVSRLTLVGNLATDTGVVFLSPSSRLVMSHVIATRNVAFRGGFMYAALDSTCVLTLTELISNSAEDGGGALYVNGAYADLERVLLRANRAQQGGGIYVATGSATVKNSTLVSNKAISGGAAYLENSELSANYSNFFDNEATANGGAAYLENSELSASCSNFFGNEAAANGGAAYLENSELSASYSKFFGNEAAANGGAAYLENSELRGNYSNFFDNEAAVNGGALFITGADAWFESVGRCTFYNNMAGSNGGVCALADGGRVSFRVDDVGGNNSAPDGAGGVAYFDHWTTEQPAIPATIQGSALYGPMLASGLANLSMSHGVNLEASNVAFESEVVVTLHDALNQVCTTHTGSIVELTTPTEGALLDGSTRLDLEAGVARTATVENEVNRQVVNEIDLKAWYKIGQSVVLQADYETEEHDVFTAKVRIWLRNCRVGEVSETSSSGRQTCTVCDENNEFSLNTKENRCRECPRHAKCRSDEATHEYPGAVIVLDDGYWRSGPYSRNIRTCPFYESCKGGVDLLHDNNASSCDRKHRGPLCALCKRKWYLDKQSGKCIKCSKRSKRETIRAFASVVSVVVACAATCVLAKVMYPKHFDAASARVRRGWGDVMGRLLTSRSGIVPMIKILYIFFQIVTSEYSTFLFVAYPQHYAIITSQLGIVLNLNVYMLMAKMCRAIDHYDELVLATTVPVVALALIFGMFLVATYLHPSAYIRLRNWATLAALVLLYVAYTAVASTIFKTFRCDSKFRRDDGEPRDSDYRDEAFLEADYGLSCKSNRYATFVAYASLMVFVYVVGTPALFFLLLWRKLSHINPDPATLANTLIQNTVDPNGGEQCEAKVDEEDEKEKEEDDDEDYMQQQEEKERAVLIRKYAGVYVEYTNQLKTAPSLARDRMAPALRLVGEDLVRARNHSDKEISHLAFLFIDYDPRFWWFETFECLRRLMLTAVLPATIPNENQLGLLYGTYIVSLFFFIVYMVAKPFALDDVDTYAILMSGTLSLILLLTIVLYVEDNMEHDLRAHWNEEVISAVLIALSIALGPILLLFQAHLDLDNDVKQYLRSASDLPVSLWRRISFSASDISGSESKISLQSKADHAKEDVELTVVAENPGEEPDQTPMAIVRPKPLARSDTSYLDVDALVYPED